MRAARLPGRSSVVHGPLAASQMNEMGLKRWTACESALSGAHRATKINCSSKDAANYPGLGQSRGLSDLELKFFGSSTRRTQGDAGRALPPDADLLLGSQHWWPT